MLKNVKRGAKPCKGCNIKYLCGMKRSRFIIISLLVILSLVLLITLETMWSVGNYRDMRHRYEQQVERIIDEATYKYVDDRYTTTGSFTLGNIERLEAIVAEELRAVGVDTPFRVSVMVVIDGQAEELISSCDETLGEDSIIVDSFVDPIVLRLEVENPHSDIIESMMWILLLQVLSIIVLVAVFVYLVVTLFRAKSIERMRQDLTHNITHELKTPIAAAQAATEALRTMPDLADDASTRNDYLDMTLDELRRLNTMVDEILRSSTEKFASAELRLEECDVQSGVERVRSSMAMRYKDRGVEWCVDIAAGCAVVADSFYLEGSISALVDNAIKYSPNSPVVTITATTKRGYTYIRVGDNGVGIARHERHNIFKKFYRITHDNRYTTSGYGIGLYFVHRVVKRHGGVVELDSTLGRGSMFTIKLPRYGK